MYTRYLILTNELKQLILKGLCYGIIGHTRYHGTRGTVCYLLGATMQKINKKMITIAFSTFLGEAS